MILPTKIARGIRGLRFRLTISYFAIFAMLLVGVGLYFRDNLQVTLDGRMHEIVEEEWSAVRGFLRIENGTAVWYYDAKDVQESFFVERLRRIILIAGPDGRVLEASNGFRALGVDPPTAIQKEFQGETGIHGCTFKMDTKRDKALICVGIVQQANTKYYLALGRGLADNALIPGRFTWDYFSAVPVLLFLTGLAGWFIAGRALEPVNQVATTAQRISGANLSVRIPSRDSGDELDNLIQTFNQMMDRLKFNFDQMRQFSTDASHELRTPVTAIRGQLEVALFTATTIEQYRDAIVNALQDVEQLSNIIRALLLLSQAETGQLVLQRVPLELHEIIQDIADQFQIPAQEAGITLAVQIEDQAVVSADRLQMTRLITNLLSNAIKYTQPGGYALASLRYSKDRHSVEFAITDTGQGIAAENLPYIFERFYKVPGNTNPEKGLGLGLSFVAWIVKAHDGRIDVSSALGKGSTFTVHLPAAQMPQRPIPANSLKAEQVR